jgi:putative methyltransferase (TIGR04325 family)
MAVEDTTRLKWNVVETTAMANEAQRVSNTNLNFFDNVAEATEDLGSVDLVFTSGALQYCPSPLMALKQLMDTNAKYLFITRTAFTDNEADIFSTQVSYLSANGPGPLPVGYKDRKITYPITYVSKSKAEEILKEKYHIQFSIIEDKAAYRVGSKEVDMFGYFCVRKN